MRWATPEEVEQSQGTFGALPFPEEEKRPLPTTTLGQVVYPFARTWDIYKEEAKDLETAWKGALSSPDVGTIGGAVLSTALAPFIPLEAIARGMAAEPVRRVWDSLASKTLFKSPVGDVTAADLVLGPLGKPLGLTEQQYKKYLGEEKSFVEDVTENLAFLAVPGVRGIGKGLGLTKKPLVELPKGMHVPPLLPGEVVQKRGIDELHPLQQSLIKGLKWFGDISIPKHWQDTWNASNLRELLIPASERMDPIDRGMFRLMRVASRTSRMALAKAAKTILEELGPAERVAVAAVLKTGKLPKRMPLEVKEKVLTALSPLGDMLSKTTSKLKPQYQEVYAEKFTRTASNLFPSLENTDTTFRAMFREQGREMITNPKEAQKFMLNVLENPLTTPETKAVMRDLYNLPAMMVDEVWDATRKANEAVLIAKIRAKKGLVSVTPKEGFLPSKHSSLKGLYVEHDVERGLRELKDVSQFSQNLYTRYFLTPWKVLRVVVRAPTLFRNIFSNFILNDIGGKYPLPFYRMDVYKEALHDMKTNGPASRRLGELAAVDTTFAAAEIEPFARMLRYGHSMPEAVLAGFHHLTNPFTKIYHTSEVWSKTAKYMWNKQHGMSDIDAVMDAVRSTFDYGDVTLFTKRVRETALPFFTWQSKSLPYWIENTIKHPVRTGKWAAIPAAIAALSMKTLGLNEAEWQDINKSLPEYIQKGWYMLMPWRDKKGQIYMMNLTYFLPGWGDFAEIGGKLSLDPQKLVQGVWQNPAYNLVAAVVSKKKWSGASLYYDWEAPDVKMSKTLAYIWEQVGVPWLPGGVDAKAVWRAYRDEPNAPSYGATIASQLGFKMQPLNADELIARRAYLEQQWRNEALGAMRGEIRKAASEEEVDEIVRKYQRTLGGMVEEDEG